MSDIGRPRPGQPTRPDWISASGDVRCPECLCERYEEIDYGGSYGSYGDRGHVVRECARCSNEYKVADR